MKKTTTSIIVALTLGVCASAVAETDNRAQKAQTLYQIGMNAMKEGNYKLARTSFKGVLNIYPGHPGAKRQLLYISSNMNSLELAKRKTALHKVIIPKVDLDNASIQEALDLLAVQVEKISQKKVLPNFIVQDPTRAFKGQQITLRLHNIPADTLLRYICDQAGGNTRWDTHAIVITPRRKASPPKPAKVKE